MALIRLGRLENLVAIPSLVRLLNNPPGGIPSGPSAAAAVAPPEGVKKKHPVSAAENGNTGPTPMTEGNLQEVWANTLRKVPGLLARSLERGGIPAISAPNRLVLRFPVEYNGAKDHCQGCSTDVETVLRELTGQAWSLRVESVGVATNGLTDAEAADSHVAPAQSTTSSRKNAREEAEKLPLVKQALEILGASLQRVDEGFGVLPSTGHNADDTPVEEET
jgi:hypothetical protein